MIVDASMPVVVRDSGKMWNKDDELEDVKCIIPDRCYATMYQEIMSYCRQFGQFDVATMVRVEVLYRCIALFWNACSAIVTCVGCLELL